MHPRGYQPLERVPGTVYRVVRLIGAGGMGTVYEVEDTTIGKIYVLKTLHPQLGARDDLARRMQDEARTLARLNHPNIVEVITAGITADDLRLPYYVMERLNGQSLRLVLNKKGRLDLGHVYHIGIDLLDALDHAHDKGVIHRDVKPDNIFLHRTSSGVTVTRLLDFGIVSMLDGGRGETAGRFLGTLRYAAPEQLRGDKPTPRTDVYAAGLVLYEMIAGRGPFDGEGDSQRIGSAHLHKAPPSVTRHVPVPKELDSLLMAALSKSPDSRPRDAFSFAASLRNLQRLEPALPRTDTPSGVVPRPDVALRGRPTTPPRPSGVPRPSSVPSPGPTGRPASQGPAHAVGAPPQPYVIAAPSHTAARALGATIPIATASPTSLPRTTLRGMVPPTLGPTLAPAGAVVTSIDRVDRGAATHSLALDAASDLRHRLDALSSAPTFAPSTSAPARDTDADPSPFLRPAPELLRSVAPADGNLGRSVAPQVRSLTAPEPRRLPWGGIAVAGLGLAGLVGLVGVGMALRRPGAAAIPMTAPVDVGRGPVVAFPAPTIAPDGFDTFSGELPGHAPRPADPARATSAEPAMPSTTPPPPTASSESHAPARASAGAPKQAPSRSTAPTSRVIASPAQRDRPGPGF